VRTSASGSTGVDEDEETEDKEEDDDDADDEDDDAEEEEEGVHSAELKCGGHVSGERALRMSCAFSSS
jgi:hypothetical protein